jgi:3-phosphoshikimate 1-carboxyvinyltransferase
MKEIKPRSSLNATLIIPGSKSITHRALIAAGLAEGESVLKEFLACEDTLYTVNSLRELGVGISINKEKARISGTGGTFPPVSSGKEIFLGNSGTSYRLQLSTVALARGEFVLTGSHRMRERPIGGLVTALKQLGVEASYVEHKGYPPVFIHAKGIPGGKATILGDQSSQFVSSLLVSGPYAEREIEIEVKGGLVSRPYVDLTLDIMERFGVSAIREGYRYFKIPTGQRYMSRQFTIEGDVSSASYLWAAAAVTGGMVTTENVYPLTTKQGDIGLLHILEEMGCRVERKIDRVVVQGGGLSGIDVDMGAMPDMVPTLAAIALFAKGKTTIRNVSHLRHKESNRLGAIASEWSRLGTRVKELNDGIIIHGGERLSGTTVDPHDDHRLAMSLAVVGLRLAGIRIRNEVCVNKSFPRFWELWDRL